MPKRKRKKVSKTRLAEKKQLQATLASIDGYSSSNPVASFKPPKKTFRSVILKAVLAAGLVSILLVVGTWLVAGRSTAERAATDLVMPTAVLWQLLLVGACVCWLLARRIYLTGFLVGWLLVGICCNARVASAWLESIEHPALADPVVLLENPVDAVVVLGGCTSVNRFGIAELSADGQRLMQAAQLWHAGKTATIICTGTSPLDSKDPGPIGRELLISIGVPGEAIFVSSGENTAGEMAGLSKFFANPPQDWAARVTDRRLARSDRHPEPTDLNDLTLALSTSAFHLPRALRLAESRGLSFIPLPCSFRSLPPRPWTGRDLIPTASAGNDVAISAKETLAWLLGR